MNKISIVYYSGTGHTRKMVEAFEKSVKDAGANVDTYKVSDSVDVDNVFSSDVIVLASPACGAEVIEEDFFIPFMEENADKFKDKKVYIFGSYGWGNGAYADDWKAQLEGFGATIVAMPVLANEDATDEEMKQLKEIAVKITTV